MCGICGIVGPFPPARAPATLQRMMDSLVHRGPDDEGQIVEPSLALGMRRLSIIDLAGGHQPVWNEDRSVAVVLNGEIYNFHALRSELQAKGHAFRTNSDTEAIAHAYEEWGTESVRRLRGMFTIAVYDRRPGGAGPSLFLARDRFGIKPLYYARAGDALVFASEVRALLASGLVPCRISAAALESYLLFGSVGEPLSIIEGVRSLPPGHCLKLDVNALPAQIEPQEYWSCASASSQANATQPPAAHLRELLEEAVRLHLIADVPLGVFLSSGIDSTALAALAVRQRAGVHTFTVAFAEQEFDESALARATAKALGTAHQEITLREPEMLARMDAAVGALDQPSMDGINTYFVSAAARQAGLKVALSGLGGDEVFGGYPTFQSAPQLERVAAVARHVPDALRSATAPAVATLARVAVTDDAARKLASVWSDPAALPQPFFFTRALFTPEQAAELRPAPFSNGGWADWLASAAQQAERFDSFSAVSWLEARSYMVNTLLRDTDSMSMAHSLEVRVPLLDHPLLEFMTGLPEAVKRGKRPKALLVDALRDILPAEIVGKRKQTFTFPWERWLRGALSARVSAGLKELHPALTSMLDAGAVRRVWEDFAAARTTWSRPWSLYVLNEWVKRHFSGACAE